MKRTQGVDSVEEKICRNIRRFDVYALLSLLYHLGYQPDEIFFKSHFPPVSAVSLLEKIEFVPAPVRRVVITINLGLFGAMSPLPSYFFKLLDSLEESSFFTFLGFFDNELIQNYLLSTCPELDRELYPDWDKSKLAQLRLLEFNSANFLHHIFHLVFPELGIRVEKRRHSRRLRAGSIRLGETILGDTPVLGGHTRVPLMGFDITLYCDEEYGASGTSWADQTVRRLHDILFPVLCQADVDLHIILVIRSQKGSLQLQQGSYLGIDRIHSEKEQNRVVVLFRGQVPAPAPTSNKGLARLS